MNQLTIMGASPYTGSQGIRVDLPQRLWLYNSHLTSSFMSSEWSFTSPFMSFFTATKDCYTLLYILSPQPLVLTNPPGLTVARLISPQIVRLPGQ